MISAPSSVPKALSVLRTWTETSAFFPFFSAFFTASEDSSSFSSFVSSSLKSYWTCGWKVESDWAADFSSDSGDSHYTVYDKAFEKKIESAKWWDYDGTMKSQGVYYSNTKTLAFSIKVDEKTTDKLYFAYYYSKDNDFDKEELKDPLCGITTGPSYYKDGNAYYNIECEKSIKPGYYCVIVSKDKSFKNPYAVAYARVLDEEPEARDDGSDSGDEAQA